MQAALLAELARSRPAELERGVNLVGPHRDDLDLGIGELPVRGYASHGEGWSAALALRLGTYELLRADHPSGGDPVLVLDDVFAELDTEPPRAAGAGRGEGRAGDRHRGGSSDVPEQLAGARYTVADGAVTPWPMTSPARAAGAGGRRRRSHRLSTDRWTTARICGQIAPIL